jgi:flagellar L-ring protein precursor FlgH
MRSAVSIAVIHAATAVAVLAQSSSLLLAPVPQAATTDAGVNGNGHNGNGSNANGYAGNAYNGGSSERDALFLSSQPKDAVLPMTRAIEVCSLYAIPAQIPRKFKVEDLVTIIVRQQKKYEGDAEMESKKKWGLSGKLSDWFRFYDDCQHLGQDKLSNGEPGFKFDYDNKYKTEGEADREDRFTTRITARIIDVKPNGNLVVEATLEEQHDEEAAILTVTGICRSTDVTPDNTVLSTQIAELKIVEKNRGALRDATSRGFVPRILSFGGGPF